MQVAVACRGREPYSKVVPGTMEDKTAGLARWQKYAQTEGHRGHESWFQILVVLYSHRKKPNR